MTDLQKDKETAAAEFDGVQPAMLNENCAYKRACFRAGWDAAIAASKAIEGDGK